MVERGSMGEGQVPSKGSYLSWKRGGKRGLPGTRRAAIVIASLPSGAASDVLSRLGREEAEAVGIEIARLPRVLAGLPEGTAEGVLREFLGGMERGGPTLHEGRERARELLREAFAKHAGATGDDAEVRAALDRSLARLDARVFRRPFEFLASSEADTILAQLREEQPQTIALVLAHLAPAKAAAVLEALPAPTQGEVVRRIANLRGASPEVVRCVEEELKAGLGGAASGSAESAGGVERAAEILRRAGARVERSALDALEDSDPELSDDIRKRLFAFEDLLRADDRGVRALLKEITTQELVVALKTASDELTAKFMSNMSRRGREMLQDEMEYLRPVRLSDVEASQMRILDAARRLEESGELFVAGRASGEEYVA